MFELKDTQDHYLESFEKQDAYNLVRKVALKSLKKFFTANESPYSFITLTPTNQGISIEY